VKFTCEVHPVALHDGKIILVVEDVAELKHADTSVVLHDAARSVVPDGVQAANDVPVNNKHQSHLISEACTLLCEFESRKNRRH